MSYDPKVAYYERKSAGLCTRCGKPSPDRVLCDDCTEKHNKRKRSKKELGLCLWGKCNNPVLPGKRHCGHHHKQRKLKWRERNNNLKREVMEAYGGVKCYCCKEERLAFLTLDHINNNGGEHRREIGPFIYAKLKKMGFPPMDLRVNCYNCNCGRAKNDGVCPHTYEQQIVASNICVPPLKDGFPFCF